MSPPGNGCIGIVDGPGRSPRAEIIRFLQVVKALSLSPFSSCSLFRSLVYFFPLFPSERHDRFINETPSTQCTLGLSNRCAPVEGNYGAWRTIGASRLSALCCVAPRCRSHELAQRSSSRLGVDNISVWRSKLSIAFKAPITYFMPGVARMCERARVPPPRDVREILTRGDTRNS